MPAAALLAQTARAVRSDRAPVRGRTPRRIIAARARIEWATRRTDPSAVARQAAPSLVAFECTRAGSVAGGPMITPDNTGSLGALLERGRRPRAPAPHAGIGWRCGVKEESKDVDDHANAVRH